MVEGLLHVAGATSMEYKVLPTSQPVYEQWHAVVIWLLGAVKLECMLGWYRWNCRQYSCSRGGLLLPVKH